MLKNKRECGVRGAGRGIARRLVFTFCLVALSLSAAGCRWDMQDQPRYKPYKKSDFFLDGRSSRDLPEGTVPRGFLREDRAYFTGKKDAAAGGAQQQPAAAPAQTTTDAAGNTLVTSFPDAVEEFPVPVTKEMLDRGEERYKIFCQVCHGPTGNGDGMIVRRGFVKPPTYNDDRLRNAPVGHFFDVITNGFGRMNPYGSMIPVEDRWAIVAYIRALQVSQNPTGARQTPPPAAAGANPNTPAPPPASPASAPGANNNANTATPAAARPANANAAASPRAATNQGGNR